MSPILGAVTTIAWAVWVGTITRGGWGTCCWSGGHLGVGLYGCNLLFLVFAAHLSVVSPIASLVRIAFAFACRRPSSQGRAWTSVGC